MLSLSVAKRSFCYRYTHPACHSSPIPTHIDEFDGCVLGHIAKALDGDYCVFRGDIQVFHRFTDGVDNAETSRFGSSQGTAAADRLRI